MSAMGWGTTLNLVHERGRAPRGDWRDCRRALGPGVAALLPMAGSRGSPAVPPLTRLPWQLTPPQLTPRPAKVTPRAHPTARLVGPPVAQVAELVDAQVSGTCGCKVGEVRV